jgi:hypothetical protein
MSLTATVPMKHSQNAHAPPQQQDEALLDTVLEKTIGEMDRKASSYARQLDDPTVGKLRRAMMTAAAIQRLRGMMTKPVMDLLMSLVNTPVGFMTDKKDGQSYPPDVIRDCAIEALLRGVEFVGNQFNIISGRCYITQEGYRRKLLETPGLSDLRIAPSVPWLDKASGQTCVRFAATWKLDGFADSIRGGDGKPGRVFAVRVNSGGGPDQTVGKAIRKGLKAVYDQIHGSAHTLDDGEIDDTSEIQEPTKEQAEAAIAVQAIVQDLANQIDQADSEKALTPVLEYCQKNARTLGPEAVKLLETAVAAKVRVLREPAREREPGEEG